MAREKVVCLKRDGGCGRRFSREVGSDQERCRDCLDREAAESGQTPPAGEAVGAVLRLQNPPGGAEVPGEPLEGAYDPVGRVLGPIESTTLERLTARGRVDTPEGQLALNIARKIEGPFLSGSEVASLSKALRETLRDALAGAPTDEDMVDELANRRRKRTHGA